MTGRATDAVERTSVPPGGQAAAIRSPNAAELGFLPALSPAPEVALSPAPEGDATREVSPFLRRIAAFLGIEPRHLAGPALDTATKGGSAVLSPFAADNPLPLVRAVIGGGVCFATAGITVRAGHTLRIEDPRGLLVTVIAGQVTLEAGAALLLSTEIRIIADRFEGVGTEPNIFVVGQDGRGGPSGADGWSFSGAPGERGGDGERGGIAPTHEFTIQQVNGRFLAETRRGNGGTGGGGGKGGMSDFGRGGDGGSGGDGGDASNGCRIVVRYGVLAQDAAFSLVSEPVRPGDGGTGGKGGSGVYSGSNGRRGSDGRPGTPSSLETIPIG